MDSESNNKEKSNMINGKDNEKEKSISISFLNSKDNQSYINKMNNEDENLLISFSNISELNKTNLNKENENKSINGKNIIKDNLNFPSLCNYGEFTPENNNNNYIKNTYNNDNQKKNLNYIFNILNSDNKSSNYKLYSEKKSIKIKDNNNSPISCSKKLYNNSAITR